MKTLTITKEQILAAEKLVALYQNELRANGETPARCASLTEEKVFRFEFKNGVLNKFNLRAGRFLPWVKTFRAGQTFELEFSDHCRDDKADFEHGGFLTVRAGSSFLKIQNFTTAAQFAPPAEMLPPVRFADTGARGEMEFQAPAETGDLSAKIKALKAAKVFAKLRGAEIQAKRDLKLAAGEHCARLAILAGGIEPQISRARLIVKARRILRAALKTPEICPAWIAENDPAFDGYFAARADVNLARAAVAGYVPREKKIKDWQGKLTGETEKIYGPKFDALQNQLAANISSLRGEIHKAFEIEVAKNGLPQSITGAIKYRIADICEFSRARMAVRDWPRRKSLLAENYVAAFKARRKGEPAAYAAGGIIRCRAIKKNGEVTEAVLTHDRIAENFQRAADTGATVEILQSQFAALPVGVAKLPPAQFTGETAEAKPEPQAEAPAVAAVQTTPAADTTPAGGNEPEAKRGEIVAAEKPVAKLAEDRAPFYVMRETADGESIAQSDIASAKSYAATASNMFSGVRFTVRNAAGDVLKTFYQGRALRQLSKAEAVAKIDTAFSSESPEPVKISVQSQPEPQAVPVPVRMGNSAEETAADEMAAIYGRKRTVPARQYLGIESPAEEKRFADYFRQFVRIGNFGEMSRAILTAKPASVPQFAAAPEKLPVPAVETGEQAGDNWRKESPAPKPEPRKSALAEFIAAGERLAQMMAFAGQASAAGEFA